MLSGEIALNNKSLLLLHMRTVATVTLFSLNNVSLLASADVVPLMTTAGLCNILDIVYILLGQSVFEIDLRCFI